MATDAAAELRDFRDFVDAQLGGDGPPPSPEECLSLWQERRETDAAIRTALEEMRAGLGTPLDEFLAGLRDRGHLP